MKTKIYNKKKFLSGVAFLLLAAISIPGTIIKFNNLDALINIKHIILDTFCILFGVTKVYRSLNSKCTKEDAKNDDERANLINMKSKSSAFNITFFICVIITIITMIGLSVTKNIMLGGFLIGIGIIPTIMIIAEIGSYFYHEKRN